MKRFVTGALCLSLLSITFGAQGQQSPTQIRKSSKGGPSAASTEVAKGSPTQAIQDLDAMLKAYRVGKNLSEEDKTFNRNLKQKILHGVFSLRELSRLALAEHWNERTDAEREDFVALLTRLLEERSLFAKEKSNGDIYNIRYTGDQYLDAGKTRARTRTVLHVPKETLFIHLDYKLHKVDAQWQVYDIIVDDASLVENYRYSFHKIISQQGYPELIRRMKSKLEEAKEKRQFPANDQEQ